MRNKECQSDTMRIAYVVSDLRRVGPTNQTLNIINNTGLKKKSIVITLFDELSNDSMMDDYKKDGIKVICLKLNRLLFAVSGKNKLKKMLDVKRITLVHSYGIKPDILCEKVCEEKNIPHVITLRNYPKEDILTRMGKITGRIALRQHLRALERAAIVVCCSKSIQEKMKNDYPDKNFYCIQNGVDTEKYKQISREEVKTLKEKYGFAQKAKIFICTNSFIPRKQIDLTIELFNKINEENKILVLLGDGVLYNEIKSNYSRDNVIFIGKTNKTIDYLRMSDYFISTSKSEGLPNAVLEAISCGIPVILSNIPQHEEILTELGDVGMLVDINNLDGIKDRYAKISTKEYDRLKYSTKNVKNSPFTMMYMGKKYAELYRSVAEEYGI